MSRPYPWDLEQAGAADLQGLGWDDATGMYLPQTYVAVVQDEGVSLTQRPILDFAGAGVTVTDDAVNGKTLVTISGGGGGGSAHIVEDEGVDMTARGHLDFQGAGVTVTDDAANDRTVVTIPGGGGSGTPELLASHSYNPGTAETKSTTSAFNVGGWVDADATNLAVTFTAPASGSVIVKAAAAASNTSASGICNWALRQGSTTLAGTGQSVTQGTSSRRCIGAWKITGLTPGNSYTYKLAHCQISGGTAQIIVGGGNANPNGEAVLEVWSA